MDHQLFVTVAEFIANGGVLKTERNLYYSNGNAFSYAGWYESENQERASEGTTIVTNLQRSWEAINELIYVSVNATPIYI